MNIPNTISLMRIIIVPFVIWLILNGKFEIAFWVFLLSAISDGLDGFIAKQFNMITKLGTYLDPIADKALLVSVYLSLGAERCIPMWLVIMVVFRDILIVGGALVYQTITLKLTMAPLMTSKINTVVQMIYAGTALAAYAFTWNIDDLLLKGAYGVALTTVLSGGLYIRIWSQRASEMENKEARLPIISNEDRKL